VKRFAIIVSLAVAPATWAQSKEAQAPAHAKEGAKSAGGVSWEGQVIKATGSGAPDMKASNPAQARLGAENAAKLDAFRNLLAQVKGIHVSADRTVADEMNRDEVRGKVEGVIRGFKVTAKRYFSDSGVEMDVEVPLAMLTEAVAPVGESSFALNTKGEKKNTGLIIDARGLGVQPALAPRLLDAAGNPVYGADTLSPDVRKTTTVAGYHKTVDDAKKSPRLGSRPLVVKAAKVQGSDVVLTEEAMKELVASNNAYLSEGRVAIVTADVK
jgi:hypothetical protein